MRVLALSDPHLALGTPGKAMDRFGPRWVDHAATMARRWDEVARPDDLVLVPGDVSWASTLEQAAPDLAWLAERPGTKVLIKGNHEHWWSAITKVRAALPDGVLALQADAARVGDVAVCGTRLWDVPGVDHHDWIEWVGEPISPEVTEEEEARALKIYRRERGRLERALAALEQGAAVRVAMVHYPPVSPGLAPNELTALFEAHRVDHVVFGHLHAVDPSRRDELGGTARGVTYHCASCDVVDFTPVLLCET